MLYLVGTPIGNTQDMSPRAKEILANADIIACEDTRRTGLLLNQFGIKGKLISYHEHNKASKSPQLLSHLLAGETVAQVSDAGMPSISDPGEDLVKLCIDNNIEVSAIPGPVAGITALVLSGLDTRRYHFEGFLPSEGSERKVRLEQITKIHETMIIYEAPHRLLKLIGELEKYGFGECRISFSRELTKKYEEVIRLKVNEALDYFTEKEPRGEFVVCLEPISFDEKPELYESTDEDIVLMINSLKEQGKTTKEIAKEIATKTGRNKKEIYEMAITLLK